MTKKKTELTTTKQIETRVKRQVVLEDGKVVQDSGPIVETNTTEDTDKRESESVEVSSHSRSSHAKQATKFLLPLTNSQRRNLGGDEVDGPKALENFPSDVENGALIELPESDKNARTVLTPRADGLVRESKTKKVVSREEIQERTEVEDVKHLGDFSDEVSLPKIHFQLNLRAVDQNKNTNSNHSINIATHSSFTHSWPQQNTKDSRHHYEN